jgi:hypothetical protein
VSAARGQDPAAWAEEQEDPPSEPAQAVAIIEQDHLEFEQQQNERSWVDFHTRR